MKGCHANSSLLNLGIVNPTCILSLDAPEITSSLEHLLTLDMVQDVPVSSLYFLPTHIFISCFDSVSL